MPPVATRFYLDRAQLAELAGLKDAKSIRYLESNGRLLSPDVVVGDEGRSRRIAYGWDKQRATKFFQKVGRLDENGNVIPGATKAGRRSEEEREKEVQFMGPWTSVPKRYLGFVQIMALLDMTNPTLWDRRRNGTFIQPDVVIGKAPTVKNDKGEEVPTTEPTYNTVHGWDQERVIRFGLQEGLIKRVKAEDGSDETVLISAKGNRVPIES